jgi:phytoene synthase
VITAVYPWEHGLLALAHQALEHQPAGDPAGVGQDAAGKAPAKHGALLDQAYSYCTALTRAHSRTFYLASALLPAPERRAMRALYAFCRVTDDLVDGDGGAKPEGRRAGGRGRALDALENWRRQALCERPLSGNPVALAWADTRARYGIPVKLAEQLVDGVAQDLHEKRYASFEELATYCYRVAATVGLMAMHITGFHGPEAIPYAIRLGVALQLTNILRDVGEDWRVGRLYLPLEELAWFDLEESDIASGRVDERWEAFLAYQIERTRRLYAQARPGIALLHPRGRLAIAAAGELYGGILDDIEAHAGDVFHRRAHLRGPEKLRRLPGIWWRVRMAGRELGIAN